MTVPHEPSRAHGLHRPAPDVNAAFADLESSQIAATMQAVNALATLSVPPKP